MTSSSQDPSVTPGATKALIDLEIPGRKSEPLPEPPAQAGETLWGINHGAVVDNFPNNGLQLYIPAWATMSEGDSVSVLLNGGQVVTEFIAANEVNQRVTTFIEARHLEDGRHTLQHRVKRLGQADENSAETHILVKLDRPGGKDQNGDIPGHSELKLSMPLDIVELGVDADDAKEGVPVTIKPYLGMAERDVIKLSWGGVFVEHEVEADEVDQEIVVLVEEKDILAGGDSSSNGLAVTYEVYDIVDNRSEDWAAEIRVVVDTGNSRLSPPILHQATNNVLDLDELQSEPVTVQVWASNDRKMTKQLYKSLTPKQAARLRASLGKESLSRLGELKAGFILGDKIVVKMTGTTADGQRISYEAPEVLVDDVPDIYDIEIPNAVVRQLAQTQAVFTYRVMHENEPDSTSKGAFISVIGEAVRMAAPVALDAEQGAIDPDLERTTVRVPWDDSMAASDEIILKWIGTRHNLTIYDPQLDSHFISDGEAGDKKPIDFTVPGTHLKEIEGGTLELYFILSKTVGNETSKRESARAPVLNIGPPLKELDAPVVAAVQNGAIVPPYLATTLTVPAYPSMAVDDVVTYLWKGSTGFSKDDSISVNSNTVNKALPFTIKEEIISASAGGTVEASYHVIRAGTGRRSDSEVLAFSVGEPVVLDPPFISSVKDSNGQEIPDNGSTTATSVTLSGTAPAGLQVEVFHNGASRDTATADVSGQWTLAVTGLAVAAHALQARALYGSGGVSAVRGFSVAAIVVPIISRIETASGAEIPPDGVTVETSVTVTGTASASLQVEVFDGNASKGKATASASGQWTLTIPGLTVAAHAIKAKALYGNGIESAVRCFTVAAVVAPTVSSIKAASGAEIPAGGVTVETSVTVTGTASASLQVEVFDERASKGKATANASGQWTLTISGLTVAAHAIKAKALYGDGAESAVHSFTVVPAVAPTITSINDSSGADIPEGSTTYDTTVTLTGTAAIGLEVEVFDSNFSRGTATADSKGQWTLTLTALTVQAHVMKATALYGDGAESGVRSFNVVALEVVTISSIQDASGVEIPDRGETTSRSVRIMGTGTPGSRFDVWIIDGYMAIGVHVDELGEWAINKKDLDVTWYHIIARPDNGAEAVRHFRVISA